VFKDLEEVRGALPFIVCLVVSMLLLTSLATLFVTDGDSTAEAQDISPSPRKEEVVEDFTDAPDYDLTDEDTPFGSMWTDNQRY